MIVVHSISSGIYSGLLARSSASSNTYTISIVLSDILCRAVYRLSIKQHTIWILILETLATVLSVLLRAYLRRIYLLQMALFLIVRMSPRLSDLGHVRTCSRVK